MNLIPATITSKVSIIALRLAKQSPNLLFGAGVVGVIGTVVLASRATLRLEGVLNDAQKTLGQINELNSENYSEEDRVKDKALVYVKTGITLGKMYGPAVLLGTASIGMLAGSHNILNRRNAALTAAYAAVEKGFKQYRNRVIEDLGVDKDREYLHGSKTKNLDLIDENDKKVRVEKVVASGPSPYGVLFHEGNPNWRHIPEYNYMFLRLQQQALNDKLRIRGHVFLNDVYDELGFDRTPAGAVVGWLSKENGGQDGYVSFGVFEDASALAVHEYLIGVEGELFLDFNVDGTVYDKI